MHAQGIISQSGTRYIQIEEGGLSKLLPIQSMSPDRGSRREVQCLQRTAEMVWQPDKEVKDAAKALKVFEPAKVVEHNGWTGQDIYRHPDGEIIAPGARPPPKSLFPPTAGPVSNCGSLESWKAEVAEPLAGNPIPILIFCLALASLFGPFAPRPRNLGLQLIGPENSGKSALMQLASSVCGSSSGPSGLPVSLRFEQFASDSGRYLWNAFDGFLAIEGVSSFAITETQRMRARKAIPALEALSTGTAEGLIHKARYTYLLVGTESLREMVGGNPALARFTDLPIVRVLPDATHGVLSKLPDDHENSLALMQNLCEAASRNPGHASKAFVLQIMKQGQTVTRKKIERSIRTFCVNCDVDRSDGAAMVVAEQFGLIYAAGRMAQLAGILPDEWKIGPALRLLCKQNLQIFEPPRPALPLGDRLKALSKDGRIERVSDKGMASTEANKAKAEKAIGFLKASAQHEELWLKPPLIDDLLPNWSKLKGSDEARALLVCEEDRMMTKRKVFRKGEQLRFYVFRFANEGSEAP